jgi:hypothetical protein
VVAVVAAAAAVVVLVVVVVVVVAEETRFTKLLARPLGFILFALSHGLIFQIKTFCLSFCFR